MLITFKHPYLTNKSSFGNMFSTIVCIILATFAYEII